MRRSFITLAFASFGFLSLAMLAVAVTPTAVLGGHDPGYHVVSLTAPHYADAMVFPALAERRQDLRSPRAARVVAADKEPPLFQRAIALRSIDGPLVHRYAASPGYRYRC